MSRPGPALRHAVGEQVDDGCGVGMGRAYGDAEAVIDLLANRRTWPAACSARNRCQREGLSQPQPVGITSTSGSATDPAPLDVVVRLALLSYSLVRAVQEGMQLRRPRLLSVVRLLMEALPMAQFLQGEKPHGPGRTLFVCTFPGCRWARFLDDLTTLNACRPHRSYCRDAHPGDTHLDVLCTMPRCRAKVPIDSYDPALHTEFTVRCASDH
jgi:hypothetical protein